MVAQPGKICLHEAKSSHLSAISPGWDESIPISNFLENEIHHWDPTQVRYPTQVGCLTSYKQPLRQSAATKMAMIADLDKFNVLRGFFGCVVLLPRPIFLIILEMSLHTNPV